MRFLPKRASLSIAIASVALVGATSASAYSLTVGGTAVPNEGLTTSVAGATVVNFNTGTLPAGYSGGAVVTGNSAGNWASPPNDTSAYYTVGASPEQSSPGTFTLPVLSSYFGYYGGSPDTYNSIILWLGDAILATFTGQQLAAAAEVNPDGNQVSGAYWNILAQNAGEYFNKIQFVSTSNAFETDNHAYSAVPLPAAAPLLLAGLGMLGFLGFASRRSKDQS